jgi:hypothetical protein
MTILTDTRWRLALVGLVCMAAVLLLAARLHYGFLPEDDPALSYLGERTLQGGLPNVDFYDNYTGGQSYLNAFAIHLFGARLIASRIMLLLFFIPWVLAIWYLASRITSAMNALLLTLLAAVWSVPVYPAAFASWYNLYFATFGTAALFRYLETGSRRWLFLAGVWGGLSILAKLFGLYFVASLFLFLLFDEQRSSAVADEQRKADRRAYPIFVTLALAAFIAALVKLVSSADRSYGASAVAGRYYHFVLPIAAVSLLLIAREWRGRRAPANVRIIALWKRLVPVSLGVALPVAIFLVPYALRHAVGPWLTNVLLTRGRIQHAANAPASNLLILMTVPLLLLLLANAEWKDRQRRKILSAGLAVLLGMLLFAAAGHHLAAAMAWFSVAESLPLLVVVAAVVLQRTNVDGSPSAQRLLVLTLVVAISALVQFPVSAPTYFCFVASLLFLMLMALAEETKALECSTLPLIPALIFYLLFGVIVIFPMQFYTARFDKTENAAFTLPRAAGIVGEKNMVETYERVVAEVQRHAGNSPIYAGPDSPGLYFLTGHQNPTRIYLDFLSGKDAEPQRILQAIDANQVQTVVINHGGSPADPAAYNPSGPPSPELLQGLRQRFPQSTVIGFYEIRWR